MHAGINNLNDDSLSLSHMAGFSPPGNLQGVISIEFRAEKRWDAKEFRSLYFFPISLGVRNGQRSSTTLPGSDVHRRQSTKRVLRYVYWFTSSRWRSPIVSGDCRGRIGSLCRGRSYRADPWKKTTHRYLSRAFHHCHAHIGHRLGVLVHGTPRSGVPDHR